MPVVRKALIALTLLPTLFLLPSTHSQASVDRCDQLAGGPLTTFAPMEPVAFPDLKAQASDAVEACQEAMLTGSTEPRIPYQLARALLARNKADNDIAGMLTQAAEQGYAPAQNLLGGLYSHGHLVDMSDTTARIWFTRAADQDYPPAITNQAAFHANDFDGSYDYQVALRHFERAAALGDPVAMTQVGVMYWHGYGVPDDVEVAKQWYQLGLEAGDIDALLRLRDANSSNNYQYYIDLAIAAGHRGAVIDNLLYTVTPESRAAILDATGRLSWDTRREGGFFYARTIGEDDDSGMFWSIMFARRNKSTYSDNWSDQDYDAFLAPIKARHDCEDGRLFIMGEGYLGCAH